MYINVVFVIRCLYSAVSLILVREQHFIRIIYYCYILVKQNHSPCPRASISPHPHLPIRLPSSPPPTSPIHPLPLPPPHPPPLDPQLPPSPPTLLHLVCTTSSTPHATLETNTLRVNPPGLRQEDQSELSGVSGLGTRVPYLQPPRTRVGPSPGFTHRRWVSRASWD